MALERKTHELHYLGRTFKKTQMTNEIQNYNYTHERNTNEIITTQRNTNQRNTNETYTNETNTYHSL